MPPNVGAVSSSLMPAAVQVTADVFSSVDAEGYQYPWPTQRIVVEKDQQYLIQT